MTRVVVLTGAGVSAESGLSVFRGADGLWEGHNVSDVATPQAFAANPALVQRFYNSRRRQLNDVEPNRAHLALVRLEQALGAGFHLVTQNVDDLHQRAGSVSVTAMHGGLRQIRDTVTGEVRAWSEDLPETQTRWRPHVVWFGESVIGLARITDMLSDTDLFVSIGTSGTVRPASRFASIAKGAGAVTVQINVESAGGVFDRSLVGPATEQVPRFVDGVLARLEAGWVPARRARRMPQ